MWKQLLDTSFFLSFTGNLDVYVTDYVTIWYTKFTNKSFLASLKESNPGLELEDKLLVDKGTKLIMNCERLKKVYIQLKNKSFVVKLSMSFGYIFNLEMNLCEGSKELYFQKITQPLLRTVQYLRHSERELKQWLLKKDKEIEEYKREGGEIALRHLKTKAFNNDQHMKQHKACNETFGSHDIDGVLLNKTVVTSVPVAIKKEPEDPTDPPIKKEDQTIIMTEEIKDEPKSIKREPCGETSDRPMVSPNKRQRKKLNL